MIHRDSGKNSSVILTSSSIQQQQVSQLNQSITLLNGRNGDIISTQQTDLNTTSPNSLMQTIEKGKVINLSVIQDISLKFIDDTGSTSTISTIISSTDLYSHQVFPRSKEDIAKQQALFDTFIRQFDQLCDETELGGSVIIMQAHTESGFGNNIRTIMTGMYLAVATDRGMRCRSLK